MIPVIDCQGNVENYGGEIVKAIETVGFVYLKNYGIEYEEIEELFKTTDKFWKLPCDVKEQYARSKNYEQDGNSGYVAAGVEMLDPTNKAEIREAYNITPDDHFALNVPDEDVVPDFRVKVTDLFQRCHRLSLTIMRQLAIHLGYENHDIFTKTHTGIGRGDNATTLRLLHYPALPDKIEVGTVRCGAHSDYGTLTLLFQDDVGGLEVSDRSGTYVPAVPAPGCVLINTGDLLQRWTSDRLLAVKHRVLVPEDRTKWTEQRRSIAFFVHPDDACVVTPLDGSDHYPPVTAGEYLREKFSKTY